REKHPADAQPRFDGYLIRAFESDPKGAGAAFDAAWKEALGRKEWSRAKRFLASGEAVSSDPVRVKALKEIELKDAESAPVLRQASSHAIKYSLVLPKDWTPAKKWPVVVGVEGAGCDWQSMIGSLLASRGDRPFMLVTPVTFSNTNGLVKEKYPY